MTAINSQAAAAQAAARSKKTGEFGEQGHADPGDLGLVDNPLADREPPEIDAELAELTYSRYALEDKRERYADTLHRFAGDKKDYRWSPRNGEWTMTDEVAAAATRVKLADVPADDWDSRQARVQLENYDKLGKQIDDVDAKIGPLNAEYHRRPWNREYVCQNTDGHSHNSTRCSTLHKGRRPTRLYWMTEFSGKDKYELLEAAGWRICDVCHPLDETDKKDPRNRDDWKDPTSRGTDMYTPDDIEKDKARQEREAARVAREQKKLAGAPTPNGEPIRIDKGWSTESFATERSALIWATDHLADLAQKAERPDNFAPHMDEYHAKAGAGLEVLLDSVALKRVAAAHEVLGAGPKDVFGAIAYQRGVDEAEIAAELQAELVQTRRELRAELEVKGAAKWAKTKKSWDRGW